MANARQAGRPRNAAKLRPASKRKPATPRAGKRVRAAARTTETPHRSKPVTPKPTVRNPFARLAKADGVGAYIVVGERVEGRWELVRSVEEIPLKAPAGGASRSLVRLRQRARAVADLMSAAGHPQRIVILATLLGGPATYRSLQRATSLKAGPLYHHINHLRLAGLMLPKQRDLYEITRAGRNLLLIASATNAAARDRRRRPT